ncbi:glycosyltransferase family 2 protein [Chryseosolibacter indicus]|uniref:Glycosyltransferase family 2 protein n=1 Tax=Chryseosolibacter indicus TaxID=2782351 RepID=A0ABS5VNM0_9BACT|nr:glycosyltransferase family 2 protein [Chryseosolibacter indicus]MBT1702364.1 glycosyltransferase family 2 protein [Chryseosolibacter indicus]
MTQTAVVILNYNGAKFLRQFLPSVVAYSPSATVYVVDNGSSDDSEGIVRKDFPSVQWLALEENFGFCGGYNRGLRQIEAKYYVLLNSDIEVTPGWLEPMINILENDSTVAALQPKILSYQNKKAFEYAGAAGGYMDFLGYPFCRGRLFTFLEEDLGQYDDIKEIFWATGACLVIRSSVFHQFRGLDEDLFAHMEEIDLCWKIQRTENRILYYGKSKVYHVGAGTLGYESPRKTFLNFRNNLIVNYKHLDAGEICYKLPLRILLDWLAALMFLIKGKTKNSLSVIQAHAAFFSSLRKHAIKRKALHQQFPTYSRKNIYKRSVVAAFYLLRRRKIDIRRD